MEDTRIEIPWRAIITAAFVLPGIVFYYLSFCVWHFSYQVSWKAPGSRYWSGFNQLDQEVLAQETYQEQIERSNPKYKK